MIATAEDLEVVFAFLGSAPVETMKHLSAGPSEEREKAIR